MPFIVQTAKAHMPNNCWGRYRRIAVLEVEEGVSSVAMIAERARGVKAIVATWERLNVGKTKRCAYARAYADACDLAMRLSVGAAVDVSLAPLADVP